MPAHHDSSVIHTFYDIKWRKPEIPRVLESLKFIKPTEVQEKAIPLALKGQNVVAQSKTGTGKTLAFVTPIVDKINPALKAVQAVVLVPTRELCIQDADVFRQVCKPFKINVLQVYGGVDYAKQKDGLSYGEVAVIVATPGRLIDLYKQNYMDFTNVQIVVLDEADRMLDMGFFPDIDYIFQQFPRNRVQCLLFSATIFQEILESIDAITHGQHVMIRIGKNEDEFVVEEIEQEKYIITNRNEKYNLLRKIMKEEKPEHCLIFVNTINGVEFLERRLKEDFKYPILAMTGNVSQNRREKIINDFKAHRIHHLIATDVASRGLDIPNITHVILYDVPQFPENYIHRIGRTGRLSLEDGTTKRGKAIMLCIENEMIYVQRIEQLIKLEIPVHKGYGGSGSFRSTVVQEPKADEEGDEEQDGEYGQYTFRPRSPFRY